MHCICFKTFVKLLYREMLRIEFFFKMLRSRCRTWMMILGSSLFINVCYNTWHMSSRDLLQVMWVRRREGMTMMRVSTVRARATSHPHSPTRYPTQQCTAQLYWLTIPHTAAYSAIILSHDTSHSSVQRNDTVSRYLTQQRTAQLYCLTMGFHVQ